MEVKLKFFRNEEKLSQSKVANSVGISLFTYQKYEYGRRIPQIVTAMKIADILKRDVNEIWVNIYEK